MRTFNDALPIDHGWAWMITLGAFMVNFLVPGLAKSSGILYQHIMDEYSTNNMITTWIIASLAFLILAPGVIGTLLSERFTHRAVVMLGGLLCVIGLSLTSITSSWPTFLVCFIIFGVGAGLSYSPSIVLVGHYFKKKRSIANGLVACGSGLGGMLYPVLMAYLLDTYGLKGALLISAGISSNIVLAAALYRPLTLYCRILGVPLFNKIEVSKSRSETDVLLQNKTEEVTDTTNEQNTTKFLSAVDVSREQNNVSTNRLIKSFDNVSNPETKVEKDLSLHVQKIGIVEMAGSAQDLFAPDMEVERELESNEDTSKRTKISDLFNYHALKSPDFLAYFTCTLFMVTSLNIFVLFTVPYSRERGVDGNSIHIFLATFGAGDLVGRLVCGVVVDVFHLPAAMILTIGSFVCCVSLFAISFISELRDFCIVGGFYGIVGGNFLVLTPVVMAERLGVHVLGSTYGITTMGMGFLNLLTTPMCGVIRDVTGSWVPVIYLGSCCAGVAGVISLIHEIRTRGRDFCKITK